MTELTVTPMETALGAEISGMDLADPITPQRRDELYALLCRYQVLCWPDQRIEVHHQVALAESFGPILDFPSVIPADPRHPGVHTVRGSTVGWHIDASSRAEPPVATVLRAVEVPPDGGDTVWASGVAAYAALPGELRAQVHGRYVTHGRRDQDDERPLIAHPLTRTHPDTGERFLYLNFAPWEDPQVIGLSAADSAELVDRLRAVYLHEDRQLRFRWRPGAVVIWDNRVVQHTGTDDYGDRPREMSRICIAGFSPAPDHRPPPDSAR